MSIHLNITLRHLNPHAKLFALIAVNYVRALNGRNIQYNIFAMLEANADGTVPSISIYLAQDASEAKASAFTFRGCHNKNRPAEPPEAAAPMPCVIVTSSCMLNPFSLASPALIVDFFLQMYLLIASLSNCLPQIVIHCIRFECCRFIFRVDLL